MANNNKAKFLQFTNDLINFLDSSPSCFQAVDNIKKMLIKAGFRELKESESWTISPGDKCYVTRNCSSIIAFKVPKSGINSFSVIAAHSDSPCFKIKPNPEITVENQYVKLNIEKYGGMINSTWFDRPLSIAGRITVKSTNGSEIETKLIDTKRNLAVIPSLAIHMTRGNGDGKINPQKEMLPLFGCVDKGKSFLEIIADIADVETENILGTDLFIYNRDKGTIWGRNNEFFSAARIDDLECVYTSARALISSSDTETVQMLCVFDNEEVGSGTKQGAKSTFMHDVMLRTAIGSGLSECDFIKTLSSSFMLSADNGHAIHPNYSETACPTNRPYLNGGVLIKYNAQQKYTTDAVSEGIFKLICSNASIPYQEYVNRSDIPGGSTLGNLSGEQVSINTIDIGAAQLAMHSAYETAGTDDAYYLYKAMQAFYNTKITSVSDGSYKLN